MAQNQLLKRYLDAGIQFSQMTQQRAEEIVRDLIKTGEVQSEQAQSLVNDLVERSRKNTERLVEQIRKEVRNQLATAGVVTKDVVGRLQSQIDDLRAQLPGPGGARRPAKRAPARKAAPKKAGARTAGTKKSATKKAAGRARAAKKSATKSA